MRVERRLMGKLWFVRLLGQLRQQRRLLFVLLEWRMLGIEWWQLGIERRKLGRILLLRPCVLDAVRSDGARQLRRRPRLGRRRLPPLAARSRSLMPVIFS